MSQTTTNVDEIVKSHETDAAVHGAHAEGNVAALTSAILAREYDRAELIAADIAEACRRAGNAMYDARAARGRAERPPRPKQACAICGRDYSAGHCACTLSEPLDGEGPQGEDYMEALACRNEC